MSRLLRWCLAILILISVVLAGGAAYLKFGLPKDRIIADLRDELERATARPVTLDGDPEVVLWPRPGIRIGAVWMANPEWASETAMLSAPEGLLTFSLEDIRAGTLRARTLEVPEARLVLQRDDQGRINWPWLDGAGDAPLRALHLSGATVQLHEPRLETPLTLTDVTAKIAFDGAAQPADLTGDLLGDGRTTRLDTTVGNLGDLLSGRWSRLTVEVREEGLSLTWRGRVALGAPGDTVSVEGRVEGDLPGPLAAQVGRVPAPLSHVLTRAPQVTIAADITVRPERLRLQADFSAAVDGRQTTADLRLKGEAGWLDGDQISFNSVLRAAGLLSAYLDGTSPLDGPLDAKLSASVLDVPAALRWSGLPDPGLVALPGSARVSGQLTSTDDGFHLARAELAMDDATLGGEATLSMSGPRPQLAVTTAVATLDLSDVIGFTPDRIDLGFDRLTNLPDLGFDLSATIEAERTRIGAVEAEAGRHVAHLREGALSLEVSRLRLFDGEVGARALLGGLAPGALMIDIQGSGIDPVPLLERAGASVLRGPAEGFLRVSVPDITASDPWSAATGSGSLSIFGGALDLPDLFAAATGTAGGASETVFSVLSADFVVDAGSVDLSGLRLTRGEDALSGAAEIVLPESELSGRLVLESPSGADAVDLVLSGTLAAPGITRVASLPAAEVPPAAAEPAPALPAAPEATSVVTPADDPPADDPPADDPPADESPEVPPAEAASFAVPIPRPAPR